MTRLRLLLPILALPLAAPVSAQSLGDMQSELAVLRQELTALRDQVNSTGSAAFIGGADGLSRLDEVERRVSALTSQTEELELRINRVVQDGTNRIGDIEFRLCDATPGCDPLNMPATTPLGGSAAASAPAASTPSTPAPSSGPELAMGEKADFDRAKEVLGQGDFRSAATLFATFTESYPGGPLAQEAHYLRGEALSNLGETANAARAYLEAYSGDPQGGFAADALLKLGQALGTLGQTPEACVTLAEVTTQYPTTSAATQAPIAMQGLGCP